MHLIQKMMLTIIAVSISSFGIANAQEPGIDQWGIVNDSDPMTDERIATAGVATADGLNIIFQCSRGNFGAVIIPYLPGLKMDFITMESQVPVAWRIDSDNAVTETWQVQQPRGQSNNYSVISLSSENFASRVMQGEEKLTVRVHGITSSVTLENASQYVSQAMQACGLES
tara:strand:- start:705 stop:1217 length:513 start_codon:yes stop_codon:yes gene_type:complete